MSCGSNDTETRNIMGVRGRKADCVWGEEKGKGRGCQEPLVT